MSPVGWAALLIVLVPALAAAQVGPKIIYPDPNGVIQNETSITLVPSPVPGVPALIAVAYNNDPTNAVGLGFAESTDGGVTWAPWALPLPLDPGGSGLVMTDAFDPAVGVDTQGRVYTAHISTLFGWPGASGLFVHRYDWGTGGGWIPPVTVAYSPAAVGNPDPFYRFNDKCHLTVDADRNGISPFRDQVYCAWIRDAGYNMGAGSDIFFATSATLGVTWTYPGGSAVPVPINDNPYIPPGGPPSDLANGPNVAVAPDGTVYVAWMDINVTVPQAIGTLLLDRSTDGGVTWGTDRVIQANQWGCPTNLQTALGVFDARARSYPSMAVSPFLNASGFYDVYVVYPADPDGPATPDEADVFFTRSRDGGATWSPRLRLNVDPTLWDQFQPWIAVKQNGWIDVAWYDRASSAWDDVWDVVIARSIDGGVTFTPPVYLNAPGTSFVTPIAPWGERWMGEYLGLAVDDQFAYVAFTSPWNDMRGDVWFVSIPNLSISTAVLEPRSGPGELRFAPGTPNPFTESTSFAFALPAPMRARLAVHDVAGRLVRVLLDEERDAGEHVATWDGRDDEGTPVASGSYFCRLEVGAEVRVQKVLRVQ